MTHPYLEILRKRIRQTHDVYVPAGADSQEYVRALTSSILAHVIEPKRVRARVTPPGFLDAPAGSRTSGWCVASNGGYWLVYQPVKDRFCCFWGSDEQHLSAPGIYGSPLYCWSA
jgi:hypothetical protein